MRLGAVLAALVIGAGFGAWRTFLEHGRDLPVDLDYYVELTDAESGLLTVTLSTMQVPRGRLDLTYSGSALAPTAPASRFRVRHAQDGNGQALPIERTREGWRVRTKGELLVQYDVHLNLARSDSHYAETALSRLDTGGARLFGNDLFLFPAYGEIGAIEVTYEIPVAWKLFHPFQSGPHHANPPSIESLCSSVVAIGPYRSLVRRIGPCDVTLAIRGRYAFGDDDLMHVIDRIVSHQVRFFGQVPRPRYLFVVDEHPDRSDPDLLHYFGLHFDASMLVLLDPRTDRTRLEAEPASLFAHEFFHNWLGEQLRQENYEMNWFVEGVTTLYAYRTRLATRMLDHGRYAAQLQERFLDQWERTHLRASMSVADAGKIVLQDQAITRMLYTGGLLVGVALDEEIARLTRGDASLDDLVRTMVARAVDDPSYVLTRATLEHELTLLTGADFSPWLDRHVYGLEELPLPAYVTGR